MPRKPKDRRRRFGWVFARKSAHGATTWYAQWLDPATGKRITRSIGEKESDAGDYLDKIEARIKLGSYSPPPTVAEVDAQPECPVVPVAPLLVAFSRAQLDGPLSTKSDATLACYEANHKALAAYFGERTIETGNGTRTVPAKRIDEIRVADALDYRAWRRTRRFVEHRKRDGTLIPPRHDAPPPKPVSASTVNRDLQYLSMIFSFAVRDGLLPANPLAGLKMEREERRVRRYLAKAEVTKLILACDPWVRPLVVAGLFTGARGCELKSLKWGDVNLDEGKLTIYRTKVRRCDALDIHPILADELRRARAAIVEAKRKDPKRPGVKAEEFVFLNRDGERFQDVRKSWARAIKAAGLAGRAGLTFHALRHTFATHFLQGGGAVTDLMQQLGHAKLATTQHYAAMVNERRRDTVLALDYGALTARAAEEKDKAPPADERGAAAQ